MQTPFERAVNSLESALEAAKISGDRDMFHVIALRLHEVKNVGLISGPTYRVVFETI